MGFSSGPLLAIVAFILWGITPLYYQLLTGASAGELLAQRLFWSIPLLLVIRLCIRNRTTWREVFRDRRSLLLCLLSGVFMCISWYTFIYALTHHQVLDASLGYFTNPLFSIALGVIFLRDRLSRFQQAAVVLAIAGLAYQIILLGYIPWMALAMGSTFAFYGLVRKFVRYKVITALTVETLWMLPLAVGITAWQHYHGGSVLTDASSLTRWLYGLTAPVTLLPLVLFAAAIRRTSLTVIGLAQYVEPSLQFLLAVVVFGEPLNIPKMVSFSLIWLGLALCVFELFREHWRYRHLPTVGAQSKAE